MHHKTFYDENYLTLQQRFKHIINKQGGGINKRLCHDTQNKNKP